MALTPKQHDTDADTIYIYEAGTTVTLAENKTVLIVNLSQGDVYIEMPPKDFLHV